MINVRNQQLGKGPATFSQKTLKFRDYIAAFPPLPSEVNWLKLPNWGMYGNDTVGDCVEAAAGHIVDLWDSYTQPSVPELATQQIIQAYSGATGYVSGDPSTDNGTDMLSFLNYWRKTGVGGHKIAAFVSLSPGNLTELKQAIWLFGSAFIGVQLPISAQGVNAWTVPGSTRGNGAPGSWGGHCVPVGAYNESSPASSRNTVITWGQTMTMSDYFYQIYSDEAFAVLSPDWASSTNVPPNLFDLAALQADLAAL
jgi:hypothetical protein